MTRLLIALLAVGAGIVLLMGVSAVGLVAFVISQADGTIALNGGSELRYSKEIDEANVQRLANYLNQDAEGTSTNAVTYRIDRDHNRIQFGMVMKEDKVDDEMAELICRVFASQISENVFEGQPVDFVMYDEYVNPIKTLEFEENDLDQEAFATLD